MWHQYIQTQGVSMSKGRSKHAEELDVWFKGVSREEYDVDNSCTVKSEVDLAADLVKLDFHPDDFVGRFGMWHFDDAKLLDLFTRIACPIVCKGYSTPPENWHELCEAKAQQALDILKGRR